MVRFKTKGLTASFFCCTAAIACSSDVSSLSPDSGDARESLDSGQLSSPAVRVQSLTTNGIFPLEGQELTDSEDSAIPVRVFGNAVETLTVDVELEGNVDGHRFRYRIATQDKGISCEKAGWIMPRNGHVFLPVETRRCVGEDGQLTSWRRDSRSYASLLLELWSEDSRRVHSSLHRLEVCPDDTRSWNGLENCKGDGF